MMAEATRAGVPPTTPVEFPGSEQAELPQERRQGTAAASVRRGRSSRELPSSLVDGAAHGYEAGAKD